MLKRKEVRHLLFFCNTVFSQQQTHGLAILTQMPQHLFLLELDMMCGSEIIEETNILEIMSVLMLIRITKNFSIIAFRILESTIFQHKFKKLLMKQEDQILVILVILKEHLKCFMVYLNMKKIFTMIKSTFLLLLLLSQNSKEWKINHLNIFQKITKLQISWQIKLDFMRFLDLLGQNMRALSAK